MFDVSHPLENLEIHPPDPPKSQIPIFQSTQVLAMPIPSEQPANHNPVFTANRWDFYSQAPTRPYLSIPPCFVCGYTGHDRYTCPYLAFGFNAPRLPMTIAHARATNRPGNTRYNGSSATNYLGSTKHNRCPDIHSSGSTNQNCSQKSGDPSSA